MSRNELYVHVYNSVMLFFYEGIITGAYSHAESLYKANDPMGLSVAHFENVGLTDNSNRMPKELIEKYKQYIKFDEFGNILEYKAMPMDIFNEFEKARATLPKTGIIKISYINVKERNAILAELQKLEQEKLLKLNLFTFKNFLYLNTEKVSIPDDVQFGNPFYKFDYKFENWDAK